MEGGSGRSSSVKIEKHWTKQNLSIVRCNHTISATKIWVSLGNTPSIIRLISAKIGAKFKCMISCLFRSSGKINDGSGRGFIIVRGATAINSEHTGYIIYFGGVVYSLRLETLHASDLYRAVIALTDHQPSHVCNTETETKG